MKVLHDRWSSSGDIGRLLEIMAVLRDPEGGCPWDVKQDFRSIAPYTLEEAYEVADAIERESMEDLRDELGDLLLQVVFHAQMASEVHAFGFADVVRAITEKLIRRHPHIFGNVEACSATAAKSSWNAIKAEERRLRDADGDSSAQPSRPWLDEVPKGFPALTLALKLQVRAAEVGFDWSEAEQVLRKVEEEVREFRAARAEGRKAAMHDEFGDLLFSLVNLARHLDIDPEAALRSTNNKFRRRFGYVEDGLNASGSSLQEASLEQMEKLWQEAKSGTVDPAG